MFIIDFDIFEILMLICFGSSWPFAILKSLRTKSAAGKSILFLLLVFVGYAFGIAYKLMKPLDAVIWLYVLNSSMILTEIILYFRYRVPTDRTIDTQAVDIACLSACLDT